MEEALALVILALAGAVPFRRARMRGAVLPPIAGMIGAPLARALATHLLVLGVGNELLLAAIGAAALLAGGAGARGLLGMASGGFKLLVAITATPLTHPYRVKASARIYRCPKSRPPLREWLRLSQIMRRRRPDRAHSCTVVSEMPSASLISLAVNRPCSV
jgi:uncharacterized membrane protein YeaQ/YmgE (transglycosylase-associated protein family)